MFPETHEFLSWADSVPPYSQTAAEGIPNEAYVHTIQNEVRTYFTTYVYLASHIACLHCSKIWSNRFLITTYIIILFTLSHCMFTLRKTWPKLLPTILLTSHCFNLVAEYVHTLQGEVKLYTYNFLNRM